MGRVCLSNVGGFFWIIRIVGEREKRGEPRRHEGHGEEEKKRKEWKTSGAVLRNRCFADAISASSWWPPHEYHNLGALLLGGAMQSRERTSSPLWFSPCLRALRGYSFPLTDVQDAHTRKGRTAWLALRAGRALRYDPASYDPGSWLPGGCGSVVHAREHSWLGSTTTT